VEVGAEVGANNVEAFLATAAGAQRDFASLLDDLLIDEAARRASASRPATTLDFLSVIDDLGQGLVVSDHAATAGYRENAEERKADAAATPPVAPQLPQPSIDPEDIARELGISGRKKPDELDAIRRRFALANHPDRVAPEMRGVSMVRMQVANMLIDEAKRARRR
jgi:hypothetical protein